LVKALESVAMFRDVEAKTDGGRVNITLQIAAPQTAGNPASAPPAEPAAALPGKVSAVSSIYRYPDAPDAPDADAAQAGPSASPRSDRRTASA